MRSRFFIISGFILLSMASWYLLEGFILRNYIALIPILFSIQILLNDFIEMYLFIRLNSLWFKILIAPGTILHELSHAVAAKITGCKITDISLFHLDARGNLGSVKYTQSRDKFSVLRNFIVGFAPFFGCGIMLVALLNLAQSYHHGEILTVSIINCQSVESILRSIALIIQRFYQQFLLSSLNPITILILYLQICLGLGAAPSSVDFKDTFSSAIRHPVGTLILTFLFASIFYLGEYPLTSRYVVLLFKWILLILLVSVSLLTASIPLIYLGTKFMELSLTKKFFTLAIPVLVHLSINNTALTLLAFLVTLFTLRYSWIFLRPK